MDTLAHMSICNIQGVAKDSMKNEKHKLLCDNGQMEELTKLKLEA